MAVSTGKYTSSNSKSCSILKGIKFCCWEGVRLFGGL